MLEIQIENPSIPEEFNQNSNYLDSIPEILLKTESQPECRICLEPSLETNQLVTPCGCTGSVKYIHVECFRMWVDKKCENRRTRKEVYS